MRSRGAGAEALISTPAIEAAALVAEHSFFAPEGSEYRGAIVGAVKSGLEQGYKRITALSQGEVPPIFGSAVAPLKSVGSLTLATAVERYLQDRMLPVKTVSETRLALRQFEEVVGRKSMSALTREDSHLFAKYLSEQRVGGKTTGSIVRFLSPQSIVKRMQVLSRAIDHARDIALFDGDNLLKGVKVKAYAKAVDKSVMPSKRRLQVSELNAIFSHPWFTGCVSQVDTYNPGSHRIEGAEYWVPIVALFTGCRAAELGGLKASEVMLNDAHPHIIIRDNEYRRTKRKRTRRVPILDALIDLGFPPMWPASAKKGKNGCFLIGRHRSVKGEGRPTIPLGLTRAWLGRSTGRLFPQCLATGYPPKRVGR